ncbi:O-antigen ligase family protein [Microbacterium sp. BG28]|uniref:O-antigen ligase family protein n=1 Tax=Microbacterium sp. BG28 TaxID=3097356 RepID=UPI002A5B0ED9|nr:O-antigen ligase family protein [Microbacterium sp. BG28]MDY0830373.1 O-antigen ligase family protein [Microbacterium sp. BG28]
MAVRTQHPAGPAPAPPLRERTGHLLLRAWCVFVVFQAVAGTAWTLAFGVTISTAIVVATAVVSLVVWLLIRPPVDRRRLPWFVLAYGVWAAASLIWSAWPATTGTTLALWLITTGQGLFVAAMLTWREIVAAISAALKWSLGLSLAFELVVSLLVRRPILPGWVLPERGVKYDPIVYWSRNNLFDLDGRVQGIQGNANLLAVVALLGLIVFCIRWAAHAEGRVSAIIWISIAALLFVHAGSATAYLSAAAVVVVLVTVLLMRTVTKPGGRTVYYAAYAAVAFAGAAILFFARDTLFAALGRSADLTGREGIWEQVLARAGERPLTGWGFASPWLPWDKHFDGWIVDHGETVMQAHNMWIDVFLQLGVIGVLLMAGVYLTFIWRAWFFAIDRPRWDLRDDRPYSPLTLLPTLVATVLLVQGLAESGPLVVWGWMLVVLLGLKVRQSPLLGVGPAETSWRIERGDPVSDQE